VSLNDWVQYFIEGFPVGCIYALVAIGLVLTYKTSGVFNLAFGAQAFMAAAIMYELSESGLPNWLSFVISVCIISPLFGLLLDRALFRYMRNSSWVVKLVSSLGLFVALPEIVKALISGVAPQFNAPSIAQLVGINDLAGDDGVFRFGEYVVSPDRMAVVVITITMVALLGVLFRYTALGLQMRAIVESFRMVELAGVDSERVSMAAWMLSSFLAGLAGVLIAPDLSIDSVPYTLLLVAAVSAAAFGRLTSIPIALLGAAILGVGQRAIIGFSYEFDWPQNLQTGVRPALPFVALFLLLIFLPAFKGRRDVTDPLSGVDPPPPAMAHEYKDRSLAKASRIAFYVFIGLFLAIVLFAMTDVWVFRFTDAFTLAIAFLSITVFTGLGGQVSLGQAAFAGIGGYTTANLATENGWPVLVALGVGVGFAMIVGVLLAIPALRLGGIFLTLATLAFALMAQNIVFSNESVAGGPEGLDVPRPDFLNGSGLLDPDQRYLLFVFVLFAIVGFLVIFVRSGSTGRYFAALRGSETAAASVGINGTRQRILLFALSAGIAGLAGGLFAMNSSIVRFDTQEYQALFGVAWVVLVVSLGSRTVDGAANAAISFVIFQWLLSDYFGMEASIALIGFGFGAITYARHPEGIVEFRTRVSILERRKAVLLKERATAMAAAGPLPAGYLPTKYVTRPALGGIMVLYLILIVRKIFGEPGGIPMALLLVCCGASLVFALGWIAYTQKLLVRLGSSARTWVLFAVGAVVGGALGWFLTSVDIADTPSGYTIDVANGIGIGVGIICGFAIVAFFALPVQVERIARVRDFRTPPVTWRAGRGPTLWIFLGTFLSYWASKGWEPQDFEIIEGLPGRNQPLYFLGLIAVIIWVQWIGSVQGGVNELVLGEVEVAPGVPLAEDQLPEELPALPELATTAPSGGGER
jgi:branched-subunit amino acid ABC-type transport system permease component